MKAKAEANSKIDVDTSEVKEKIYDYLAKDEGSPTNSSDINIEERMFNSSLVEADCDILDNSTKLTVGTRSKAVKTNNAATNSH